MVLLAPSYLVSVHRQSPFKENKSTWRLPFDVTFYLNIQTEFFGFSRLLSPLIITSKERYSSSAVGGREFQPSSVPGASHPWGVLNEDPIDDGGIFTVKLLKPTLWNPSFSGSLTRFSTWFWMPNFILFWKGSSKWCKLQTTQYFQCSYLPGIFHLRQPHDRDMGHNSTTHLLPGSCFKTAEKKTISSRSWNRIFQKFSFDLVYYLARQNYNPVKEK